MKYFYIAVFALFFFAESNCSFSYNSSYGYKDSSSSCSSNNSCVKQEIKQQESTKQEQSFKYTQQHFSNFDVQSQNLVGNVVHKIKTTTDQHDYAFNLGLFTALLIMKNAQQNPMILKASYEKPQLQQSQLESLKINVAQVFESNVEKLSGVAQAVSNFFVRLAEGFTQEWQKSKELKEEINRSLDRHAIELPGLKHISDFVTKFSELSTQGKKIVGHLFLSGNVKDALKVVALGAQCDKMAYFYNRTRQNTQQGSNPRCKVDTVSTEIALTFSAMANIYNIDCPEYEDSSSLLFSSNKKCTVNKSAKTTICPSYEKPFELKKEIDGFEILSLKAREYHSMPSLNQNYSHFDEKYVKSEYAAAKKLLNEFQNYERRDTFCSHEGLKHLYAQALLIGHDVFNVDTIPQSCVQEMSKRYGMAFTLPNKETLTTEDIKNEINAARTHVNSHVLFMDEVPSSYLVNRLQYAEALGVMQAIMENK